MRICAIFGCSVPVYGACHELCEITFSVYRQLGNAEQPQNFSPVLGPRRASRIVSSLPQRGHFRGDFGAGCEAVGTGRRPGWVCGFVWTLRTNSRSWGPSTRSIGLPFAKFRASCVNIPDVTMTTPSAWSAVMTPNISRTTCTPTLNARRCLH